MRKNKDEIIQALIIFSVCVLTIWLQSKMWQHPDMTERQIFKKYILKSTDK
ncbi:MAG: hypothetical protein GY861_17765 [bacterium]|nr:hypothetical protein [bacterium]